MPNAELDAISVPEMRRALAVEAGMTLEGAEGPIPRIDVEEGRACLAEMLASLPLLRKPLIPEERAKLHPVSKAESEKMKAVLDELVADKDAFESLAEEGELPVSHGQVVKLRESIEKTEMLGEFQREIGAFTEELAAFQRRLEERAAGAATRMSSGGGPPS